MFPSTYDEIRFCILKHEHLDKNPVPRHLRHKGSETSSKESGHPSQAPQANNRQFDKIFRRLFRKALSAAVVDPANKSSSPSSDRINDSCLTGTHGNTACYLSDVRCLRLKDDTSNPAVYRASFQTQASTSKMKMFALAAVLATAVIPIAHTYTLVPLAYSTIYDEASTPVDELTCGAQLKALGYTTLGSLPGFPYIGGSANVTDADAAKRGCGECVLINFAGAFAKVLVVDHADEGIVVSEQTMQWLAPDGNVTHYQYGTAALDQSVILIVVSLAWSMTSRFRDIRPQAHKDCLALALRQRNADSYFDNTNWGMAAYKSQSLEKLHRSLHRAHDITIGLYDLLALPKQPESPTCGTCYLLEYEGNLLEVLIIETGTVGLVLSKEAQKSCAVLGDAYSCLDQIQGGTSWHGVLFVIAAPDVYKSPNSDCYIVFGEAKIEDMNSQAQLSAAQQLASGAGAGVPNLESSVAGGDHDDDDIPELEAVEEEGPVDESGVDPKDIELVIQQVGCSRAKAVRVLKDSGGDLINAIMAASE
ncbi:predicted protein [Postia placenta Mad-698-R]|nr:predicted protein [Postia placenta Mad-698-R]